MKIGNLNIAMFSDVHLGHPNTTAPHIIRSLDIAFPDNSQTAELDIIFIAGDLFDRGLNLPDTTVADIKRWITRFLRICKKHDIVLRILEGTPSHDWQQSELIITINEIAEIQCDVAYFKTLTIERIEKYGIDVMYIPDEWKTTTDETWIDVNETLKANRMDMVDYVVMHGAFKHQMPENLHGMMQLHDPQRYLGICRYDIYVGHIHTHSQNQRIIAAGSFDRLAHNEEAPKGHVRIHRYLVNDVYHTDYKFIVNKNAREYRTVDCRDLTADEASEKISKLVGKLKDKSSIRIFCNKTDAIVESIPTLSKLYSHMEWARPKVVDNNKEGKQNDFIIERPKLGQSLTKTNLVQLLIERCIAKNAAHLPSYEAVLMEVIND